MRRFLTPRAVRGNFSDRLVRILADATLVNVAFAGALLLRIVAIVALDAFQGIAVDPGVYRSVVSDSLGTYGGFVLPLTALCLAVFHLSGFYTFGRGYQSRYKVLLIFQATALAYVVLGFLIYFVFVPLGGGFPRTVLVGSAILTAVLVAGARFAADVLTSTGVVRPSLRFPAVSREIRTVLVIGGAGYLGSVLVRRLLQAGYSVRVLDSFLYGEESLAAVARHPRLNLVRADFRHIEAVVSALQGVDAVIHLGAIVGDPACANDEDLAVEVNTVATRMIAEVSRGYNVQRFLFASTCSAYGASSELLTELSVLNPLSLYARTKIESEKALLAMNDERFSPVILRFATLYGLSPRPRFDLVINLLAAQAAVEGAVRIFGGSQWRPFVHVEDAAEILLSCLKAPLETIKGQVFNAGSFEQNYQIRQIGEIVHELLPNTRVEMVAEAGDPRNYRVSFERIQRTLNFTPRRGVAEGMQEIIRALESGQVAEYRSPRYNNYEQLQGLTEMEALGLDHYLALLQPLPAPESPVPSGP